MTRDPAITSRIMRAVRSTNTGPEMLLRRALFARGLRYRVRTRLPGHPDLVFSGPRVAVFVDGDRWHGNGWRARGLARPEDEFAHANSVWWQQKIEANVRHDRHVDAMLTEAGWTVLRLWESDVLADIDACSERVLAAVRHQLKRR